MTTTTTQDSRTLLARAEAALTAVAPAPSSDVPQRIHPAVVREAASGAPKA